MTPSSPVLLHEQFERLWLKHQYPDALLVATEELSVAQKYGDSPHPDLVRALWDMAMAKKAVGAAEESAQFSEKASEVLGSMIAEAAQKPDAASTADFFVFEADRIWLEKGNHPEVHSRLDRAQSIREKIFGPRDCRVAEVLARRAEVAYVSGELAEAETNYRQAIDVLKSATPTDLRCYRKSMQGLGLTLAGLGRDAEAEVVFSEAVCLTEKEPRERQTLYFLLIYRAQCLERLNRAEEALSERSRAENLLPRYNPGAQGFDPRPAL